MKSLILLIAMGFGFQFPASARQSVIIRGEIDEKDESNGSDYFEIKRVPLSSGDFVAALLVSENSSPQLTYRFTPRSAQPDPKKWISCYGSHGLLDGMTAKRFVAKPTKGEAIPFTLQPPFETVAFAAGEEGILELKVTCSQSSPYFFIIGKEKFSPVAEVLAKSAVEPDDPKIQNHSRYKDHVLPKVEGGFQVDTRPPAGETRYAQYFEVMLPNGFAYPAKSSRNGERALPSFGRMGDGEHKIRIISPATDGILRSPVPYELLIWKIPDLYELLNIKPATE